MKDIYKKSKKAASYVQKKLGTSYDFCMVTGSGLSILTKDYTIKDRLAFEDVPFMKKSTFHNGEFLLCQYKGKKFLVLSGRIHYYEGYSAHQVTFPVRILAALGIRKVIFTNAAGGLNETYSKGEIVMVRDHINLFPEHPLRGYNDQRLGPRFPDMSNAYSKGIRKKLRKISENENIPLKEGVYVGFQGPSLETPAEYKFMNIIGGDMVGMSTVPEVIVANSCGMKVLAFSVITNICYPPELVQEVTVEEVIRTANKAASRLAVLINKLITTF